MSLDVSLYEEQETTYNCACPICDHEHTYTMQDELYEANITHNLSRMASEAGIHKALWRPEEINATRARDIIKILEDGLAKLVSDPDHFKAFNPSNGWGSYDGLVRFVENYLAACKESPDAIIRVSR